MMLKYAPTCHGMSDWLSARLSSNSRFSTCRKETPELWKGLRTGTRWQPLIGVFVRQWYRSSCGIGATLKALSNLAIRIPTPTFRPVFWNLLCSHNMNISKLCRMLCKANCCHAAKIWKHANLKRPIVHDGLNKFQQISSCDAPNQLKSCHHTWVSVWIVSRKDNRFESFNRSLFEFCGRSDIQTVDNCHGAVSNGMAVTHKVPVKCLT